MARKNVSYTETHAARRAREQEGRETLFLARLSREGVRRMENGNTLRRAPIALPREKNCCDKWGRSSLTGKIRKLLLNGREGIKRRTKYGPNCYQKICQTTISGGKMTWRGRDVNWREELVLLQHFDWLMMFLTCSFCRHLPNVWQLPGRPGFVYPVSGCRLAWLLETWVGSAVSFLNHGGMTGF